MFDRNLVINFHAVEDPVWMEKILLFLDRNYKLISIEELDEWFKGKAKLTNSCLLTFDDGHRTFFSNVFPLLTKYRIPACLFVSPDIITKQENFWFRKVQYYFSPDFVKHLQSQNGFSIEKNSLYECRNKMKSLKYVEISEILRTYEDKFHPALMEYENITQEQLKEIHKSGLVNIGAHTINHPILANESYETSKTEIVESIEKLNELLNYQSFSFAYPNGIPELDFGSREQAFLKMMGIRYAFSTRNMFLSKDIDKYSIPRTGLVDETIGKAKLKLVLGPAWDFFKNIGKVGETEISIRQNIVQQRKG
ncbi:polysaccharide deacetylase family protein [Marinilabiliaceae bacterium ANBcel2]|nr:polysaccharide deacetylase family protein [Marinilabiliaceae bacterium ANBcel2]